MNKGAENSSGHDQPGAQDFLRHLLRETPDNIYFKDAQGRFLLISDAMARYFNLDKPEDACGKTDFDFFSEEHAREASQDERMIIETGRAIIGKEEKETWPDGRETWVSTSKEPIADSHGRIIGTFGTSRDITERKEAEARELIYTQQLKESNEQMLSDLALAGEMQAALLPTEYPSFPPDSPRKDSALQFAHVYYPSQLVGGDFFSVRPLSDSTACIFICDGIGHGVRAALLAAILSALFRERASDMVSPVDCLTRMDRALHTLLQSLLDVIFATAFCMTIDIDTGEVQFANAGHPSPLIIRKSSGETEHLCPDEHATGPALGLVQDATFHAGRTVLNQGDRIVIYTDGLIEVMDSGSEQLGELGLANIIKSCAKQNPRDMLETIAQQARAFSHDRAFCDDVCALCVERT